MDGTFHLHITIFLTYLYVKLIYTTPVIYHFMKVENPYAVVMAWPKKVMEIQGSFHLILPKDWIKGRGLRKGSQLKLELLDDGNILLRVMLEEQSAPGQERDIVIKG